MDTEYTKDVYISGYFKSVFDCFHRQTINGNNWQLFGKVILIIVGGLNLISVLCQQKKIM